MDASYSQKHALEVEKVCMCELEMQWFHFKNYVLRVGCKIIFKHAHNDTHLICKQNCIR